MKSTRRGVYVSGRGAVSAYGAGLGALVEGVFSGRLGLRARERTTAFRAPTEVAGEFPAADLPAGVRDVELPFHAGLRAAHEALGEAGIDAPGRLGLILGTTKAELSGVIGEGEGLGFPSRLATRLVAELGLGGVLAALSTACTSGLSAIASAERRIALGEVDRVLVIGVDALSHFIMAGFGSMGMLDPGPCRPFDAERRGISLGDGAGAVVLTAHAEESIGVLIAGHGGANDACSVTSCHREGRGVALAAERALEHAGIGIGDIDVVHLHGTGTKANDYSEATGLSTVFGQTPPAFGTKGQMGHTLGAAGVLESLLAIAALERARVPANAGLAETNVDRRLTLTRAPARLARARHALKVSGGFGGIQQAMVFQA